MPASRSFLHAFVWRPALAVLVAVSAGVLPVDAKALPAAVPVVAAIVQPVNKAQGGELVSTLAHKIYLPLVTGGSGAATTEAQIYWGALVNSQAPTSASLQSGGTFNAFEASVNKGMSILHWGQPWEMGGAMARFQTSYFDNTRTHGSIPMLDWGSWALGGGTNQPKYKLSTITAGNHDSYIRQWAQDAKAWGHPFFLRFDWEMNGNWQFPWSAQLNGNNANDYVQAWRHVHDIFTQVGATNATWVWCPNISGSTTLAYSSVYPGDAYVDWTCLDGYNFYTAWINSSAVFSGKGINWLYNSYAELLSIAPSKPIMIGETSSVEAGDGGALKAAWIREMLLDTLPNEMPNIKAVVWFNWDANNPVHATLPLDSSRAATDAFEQAIGSSYFAANQFSTLDISPIPAP